MDEKKLLAYLKTYHKLGFNIIPAKGKVPVFSWKKYQTEKISFDSIYEWFFEKYKESNIALITGKISNVVVIDVDDSKNIPEWLKGINTWIAKTSRGYHFYFKINGNNGIIPSLNLDIHIQLKGEGGIVILPESLHPSGSIYKWVKFIKKVKEPADFEIISRFIPQYLHQNTSIEKKPLTFLYKGVPEGERNVSLTRIAGSLFADGLNVNEVYEVLSVINQRNIPPLSEKEVKTIVKSIEKQGLQAKKIMLLFYEALKEILLKNDESSKLLRKAFASAERILAETEENKKELILNTAGRRVFPTLYKTIAKHLIETYKKK